MAELSTNPFRKKGPASVATQPAIPQATSPAAFLESITSTPESEDPREGRPIKTKVVKRVRVQSPPPLSPDSPIEAPDRSDDSSDDDSDPFEQRFPEHPDRISQLPEAAPLVAANQGPTNPFNKVLSLQEIEHDKEIATTASAPGKAALDVNAFQRLLLTGQSGQQNATPAAKVGPRPQPLGQLGGDNSTETSSISKQSISDNANDTPSPAAVLDSTPRTSHEVTDHETEETKTGLLVQNATAPPTQKRAPPPPSSRHGKVIKPQPTEALNVDGPPSSSPALTSPTSREPSDVNKPLPPAPRAPGTDDEAEDIFSREAAGKVPENDEVHPSPGPPTPSGSIGGKRPTPAPPPRRGHAKSESRSMTSQSTLAPTVHDDDPQPRSSVESQHSRPESIMNKQAPAPPPPRRPGIGRPSSLYGFPTSASTSPSLVEPEASPLGMSTAQANTSVDSFADDQIPGQHRIAPPPPPARNPSTRRANPRNPDASRRAPSGKENQNFMPPPPPPPRQRGSSKGSMDAPGPISRTSLDGAKPLSPLGAESRDLGLSAEPSSYTEGKGADILADLDALQREVDALRGKF